jgi:Fe-S-cluster-containing dehydrogenase component
MAKKKYGMAMDTRKCVGCNACVIACKTENDLPLGSYRDWIRTETRGKFPTLSMEIRSERCNHCDNPPCVGVCPTGSSHVNVGGTVQVNHDKCSGCKACIAACPYDARHVHRDGYVDKCTFCLHRVQQGKQPACVTQCPTRSLTFGDLNDPDSELSKLLRKRRYKVRKPETGARPRHFYLT